MEDLSAAGYQDVVDFFKKFYLPNNASLVIAGDIDPVETKALVEKWFGEIKPGPEVTKVSAEPVKLEGIVKKTIEDKVALPLRMQVWPTPPLYAKGDADMDVLASILAGGKNSRLYKRLVYELEIAQAVSAMQSSSNLGSFFAVQYIPRPGVSLEKIQAIVAEEITKLQNEPPTPQEIERVVNMTESSYFATVEHVSEKAELLNNYWVHFGNPDSFDADLERYRQVTPQSVMECARQYLDLQKYVELTVVPEKEEAPHV